MGIHFNGGITVNGPERVEGDQHITINDTDDKSEQRQEDDDKSVTGALHVQGRRIKR